MTEGDGATHVVIVGGSLVGLSAALALAREGATVTVLERTSLLHKNPRRRWGIGRRRGAGLVSRSRV